MPQPPSIRPASGPGPGYDPMDRIVQDLQNIQSFLSRLAMNPRDLSYLDAHLSQILSLRRTISQQLEQLAEDPYNYPPSRLSLLHKENEVIFTYLEGIVGSMNPWNEQEFNKFLKISEKEIVKFDNRLTP